MPELDEETLRNRLLKLALIAPHCYRSIVGTVYIGSSYDDRVLALVGLPPGPISWGFARRALRDFAELRDGDQIAVGEDRTDEVHALEDARVVVK